jgi:hypothetical protein
MGRVFAPKPLIVAALIGAAGYFLLRRTGLKDLALGAALGVAVQAGVRLTGAS